MRTGLQTLITDQGKVFNFFVFSTKLINKSKENDVLINNGDAWFATKVQGI